jgi:hypothetical protein
MAEWRTVLSCAVQERKRESACVCVCVGCVCVCVWRQQLGLQAARCVTGVSARISCCWRSVARMRTSVVGCQRVWWVTVLWSKSVLTHYGAMSHPV